MADNEFSEGHSLDGHEIVGSPTPPHAPAVVQDTSPTPLRDNFSVDNIKRRWKSETPPFFQKIHKLMLWFAGTSTTISVSIFGLIQQYPSLTTDFSWLSKAAGICALIGAASAIQAKMAVNNPQKDA